MTEDQSGGPGIHVRKKRTYTVVYDDLFVEGMSARAWGVYTYLLTRPDGWECRVGHLKTQFREGRDALYTAVNELAMLGLMTKEPYRDVETGLTRWHFVLDADRVENPRHRRSTPDTDSQDAGNPDTADPDTEKPGQVITDVNHYGTKQEEEPSSSQQAAPEEMRPDVGAICSLLADLVEGNGCKRPAVRKDWLTAARLMVDVDGRDPEKATALLRWVQGDPFWAPNVLSMPKFRKQYDQLRLKALAAWELERQPAAARTPFPSRHDVEQASTNRIFDAAMERALAADAAEAAQRGARHA